MARKIYRHENNQGSVIEFDYWGKLVKLFVADAVHRLKNLSFDRIPQAHGPLNLEETRVWYPLGGVNEPQWELTYAVTDAEFQAKWPSLKNDGTAKENTDRLVQSITAEAAHYCRAIEIDGLGELDIPNIYELFVLYQEADRLDAMDPTFESFKDKGLGCKATFGRFQFAAEFGATICSSSECNAEYMHCIGRTGIKLVLPQDGCYIVVPVKELD